MPHNPLKLFSLKGKVIIITGGAGFLGTQYARALTGAGAKVVLWDMKKVPGVDLVDITDELAVQAAVKKIMKKYGRIDALVNNAAMNPAVGSPESQTQFVPYEKYPIDLWKQELMVNLTGMMICTKAVAPIMMKQKSGSIVNIASELSVTAHDYRFYDDPKNKKYKSVGYTTTKSGVLGLTRQWAVRLGQYSVRINAFSPVGMQTDKTPKDFIKRYAHSIMFGRMARPGEYTGAIIFLCSDASAFMTGHNLVIDGGKTAW